MKGKKILALLMAMSMGIGVLSGCGSATEEDAQEPVESEAAGDAEAGEWDEDPAEVNWVVWAIHDVPSDEALAKVTEAINEITIPKINVDVNLQIMDMGTYMTQMPMMVTSGEKVDLITTFPAGSGNYSTMSAQNQLLPLDDLLEEYGQGILETVSPEILKATTKDGQIVSIPVYQSFVSSTYWQCRKAVFDTLGIDAESVKTIDDIHEVLLAVKEKYPEMYPLSGSAQNGSPEQGNGVWVIENRHFDNLGASLQFAISNYNSESGENKVVNKYETEEFKSMAKTLKQWYDEGLIDKDIANKQDEEPTKNPNAFSWWAAGNNARVQMISLNAGEELVSVKLMDADVMTSNCALMTMGIPTSATEPEGAMRLMNLLYTDAEVKSLFDYGIEGVHYDLDEQGCVVKKDPGDGGYNVDASTIVGNVFLSYPQAGADLEALAADEKAMETATYSPLMGFSFDVSAKSDIHAQLSNIFNEYVIGLMCGSGGDVDTALENLNSKAKAAGLDEYLQEAQSQLDAWLEANGK